jgi:hypothetical protein
MIFKMGALKVDEDIICLYFNASFLSSTFPLT